MLPKRSDRPAGILLTMSVHSPLGATPQSGAFELKRAPRWTHVRGRGERAGASSRRCGARALGLLRPGC